MRGLKTNAYAIVQLHSQNTPIQFYYYLQRALESLFTMIEERSYREYIPSIGYYLGRHR